MISSDFFQKQHFFAYIYQQCKQILKEKQFERFLISIIIDPERRSPCLQLTRNDENQRRGVHRIDIVSKQKQVITS